MSCGHIFPGGSPTRSLQGWLESLGWGQGLRENFIPWGKRVRIPPIPISPLLPTASSNTEADSKGYLESRGSGRWPQKVTQATLGIRSQRVGSWVPLLPSFPLSCCPVPDWPLWWHFYLHPLSHDCQGTAIKTQVLSRHSASSWAPGFSLPLGVLPF